MDFTGLLAGKQADMMYTLLSTCWFTALCALYA